MTAPPIVRVGRERSSLVLAGSLFTVILTSLALIDAKSPETALVVPSLAQLGRAVQLFHGPLPYLAALPVLSLAVLAWSSVLALWLIYLWLIWRLHATTINLRWVAGGAIGLSLLAVLIPPLFSTDVFSYAMFGRLAGVYDLNPYLSTANNAARADPLMPYLYWRNIASPYGPGWSLVSWVIAHGASATPFVLVVRFKLIALCAVLVNGALIHHLVRVRWPKQASWAYLAFAWNPLVLIDGIVVGHNDILILLLVLISAELVLRTRPVWAMVGLAASVLIKYSTMPVVGVAMIRELIRRPGRQRVGFIALVGVVVLALSVAAFLPFWAGFAVLTSTLAEPDRGITNPLWRIVLWGVSSISEGRLTLTNPTAVVAIALSLFAGWQLFVIRRERSSLSDTTVHDDLAAWAQTLVVFLLLWPRLHTWYALVPAGLALAAGPANRWIYVQVLALTLLSYLAYV